MSRFYFGYKTQVWAEYTDFDIFTDEPKTVWRLSYDDETNHWYAVKQTETEEGYKDIRNATRQEIAQMLATMPVNQLPASALLGG